MSCHVISSYSLVCYIIRLMLTILENLYATWEGHFRCIENGQKGFGYFGTFPPPLSIVTTHSVPFPPSWRKCTSCYTRIPHIASDGSCTSKNLSIHCYILQNWYLFVAGVIILIEEVRCDTLLSLDIARDVYLFAGVSSILIYVKFTFCKLFPKCQSEYEVRSFRGCMF